MAEVSQREIDALKAKNTADENKITDLEGDIEKERSIQKSEIERLTVAHQEKLKTEVARVTATHANKISSLEGQMKQIRADQVRRQKELETMARQLQDMLKRTPANDNASSKGAKGGATAFKKARAW